VKLGPAGPEAKREGVLQAELPVNEKQLEGSHHGLGRVPELALGMATGSMMVAVAFAGARSSEAWATDLYWVGQVTIYAVPAAFLLFRRSILKTEAIGIAFLLPMITYLILMYYSPGQFRFIDEFQHVQTAQSILATHHLFHANTALFISPQYPALEIITTAIVTLTHLSITASGLIVAGIAHVLVGVCLYLIVSEVTNNPRVSALAVVIYATGLHYQFFDSYFIYQTIAIPFFLLSILAVVKMLKGTGNVANAWGMVAVVCGTITAVSHHTTSYALIGVLLCFEAAALLMRRPVRNWRLHTVFFAILAIVAVWDLRVAPTTLGYIKPLVESLLGGHFGIGTVTRTSVATGHIHGVTGNPPLLDSIMEYVAILLLVALTPLGAWRVWNTRHRERSSVTLGLVLGSVSLLLAVAVRVVASDGSELAGRAMTFVLIPVSFVCAVAIAGLAKTKTGVPRHPSHRNRKSERIWKWGIAAVGMGTLIVLAIGGITGGWPPYYARLPGPYRVSAWERSVDQHNLDASSWVAAMLPPNNGVASDAFTTSMMSALGHQASSGGMAKLFLSPRYTSADRRLVRTHQISFVVVDRRITEQLPASGYYFAPDPDQGSYTKPLPRADIDKFNAVPGVSRIFDDGTIVIYDLEGSAYTR